MYVASIIIPIRANKRFSDHIRRLRRLLSVIPSVYEVVLVDDGSPSNVSRYLKYLIEKRRGGKYVRLATGLKKFSLSRARNRGVLAATTEVILFHDVDFIASPSIYHALAKEIQDQALDKYPEKFFCVPVAFLTQQGSMQFLHDIQNEDNYSYWSFKDYSNETDHNVNFLVHGSSCIVCNRQHLLSMGGHNEKFYGHGAEDFELLHRLGRIFPIAVLPPDYTVNTGSGLIKEYRGFRAYFAKYGLECQQKGIVLVHLYHPKRAITGYYKHKRNFKLLKNLMEKDLAD